MVARSSFFSGAAFLFSLLCPGDDLPAAPVTLLLGGAAAAAKRQKLQLLPSLALQLPLGVVLSASGTISRGSLAEASSSDLLVHKLVVATYQV